MDIKVARTHLSYNALIGHHRQENKYSKIGGAEWLG